MSHLVAALESRIGWPLVMLLGVALVTLAALADGLFALTGLAVIALGAGGHLAERPLPGRRADWLLLHTLVYGMLYALFLGARLHAGHAGILLWGDLVGSFLVIGVLVGVLRRGVG